MRKAAILAFSVAIVLDVSITMLGRSRSEALAATEGAIGEGNLTRSLIVGFLAIGTIILLASGAKIPRRAAIAWTPYLMFSTMTIGWSVAPDITIRRLLILIAVVASGLVIGRNFFQGPRGSTRMFQWLVAIGFIALLGVIVRTARAGSDIAVSAFLSTGELNGEGLGLHAGEPLIIGLLAAIGLVYLSETGRQLQRRKFFLLLLIFGILASLVLLKVRFLLATTILALLLLLPRSLSWPVRITLLAVVLTASLGIVAFANLSELTETGAGKWITQDQSSEYLESLSGRKELWIAAWDLGAGHRWLGLGFGAVWTPETLAALSSRAGFKAVHAHNGYIDELLATGIIGLALLSLPVIVLCRSALTNARRLESGALGMAVLGLFLAWNLTDSILQNFLDFSVFCIAVLGGALEAGSKPAHGVNNEARHSF